DSETASPCSANATLSRTSRLLRKRRGNPSSVTATVLIICSGLVSGGCGGCSIGCLAVLDRQPARQSVQPAPKKYNHRDFIPITLPCIASGSANNVKHAVQ